jgi:hypothetical protein
MTKLHAIGGVLVVAACGAWLLYSRKSERAEARQLAETRDQIGALRAQMHDLSRSRRVEPSVPARAVFPLDDESNAGTGESAPASETSPDAAALAGPKHGAPNEAETVQQLDRKFTAEARDSDWTGTAERDLHAALSATLPEGTTLGKVECRTSFCRVESFHQDLEHFQQFVDKAYMGREKQVWNAGFTAVVTSQSPSRVTALSYVAREGQAIPALEPVAQ